MTGLRLLLALVLLCGLLRAGDDGKTVAPPPEKPPPDRKALNKVFRGRIIRIKKKKVTIYYDFEDPAQLEDFEPARPPRLLDASQNQVSIQGGRLVLEGSSAIRHKMEGKGKLEAHFYVRVSKQSNVGTVFTEPILSDFYIVLNLFDDRFYEDGAMIMAACGLHEDEGAQDISSGLVNWRDLFKSNLKKKVKVGQDAEVDVWKDGWTEYCRVTDVEGKGSSKGKCKEMDVYKFGLWVHHSRATFDDLTITFDLTDEFLDLNDLKAVVEQDWEDVPTTGPYAGMEGVPPRLCREVEQYAKGAGDAREVVGVILNPGLSEKIREVAARVLADRQDPRAVPFVVDGLYSEDQTTRKLAIGVVKAIVGQTFGYSPSAGEKARSKAIQKLNSHLSENKARYYG